MSETADQNSGSPAVPRPDAEGIVRDHWLAVHRLLYRLTANVHDAEELTQETFLRAVEKLDQFKPGTNVKAWLMRIATNAFLDTRRRASLARTGPIVADLPLEAPGVGSAAENGESAAMLAQALTQLPDVQRAVFVLRSTEGASFAEIADVVGTAEPTARWHMLKAREKLMELLEGKL